MDFYKILNIKEEESIWLSDGKKNELEGNPYRFEKGKLLDANDRIADEVLGRLIRNDVIIRRKNLTHLKIGTKYSFINENLEVKTRRYKQQITDIFNIFIGNIFLENIPDKEKLRIASIYKMILEENKNAFPYEIKEGHNLFMKILGEAKKEEKKKNILFDKNCDGLLKKLSEE